MASPFFGKRIWRERARRKGERMLRENAEYMVEVYSALEYSTIPVHYLSRENIGKTARYIRELTGDHFMLTTHGDGTFSIPSGDRNAGVRVLAGG
ncbi:MAG: hypothetical protein ACOX6S_10345 [Clostridia bacterium]